MKKFLKIQNNGLIHKEDLTLVGSSTKRGSDKIGQYGSGNKFALAYLLRNDILPIIYQGKEQLPIDFEIVLHRDNPVRVLTVAGEKTSITSGMGELDWKCWMALREIISNAIDEGGFKLSTIIGEEELTGEENKTNIFIPINHEVSEILINYDHYFAFKRREIYANSVGRIFYKEARTKLNIFRKGIRCYDSSQDTTIDFDFNNITINESRLTTSVAISSEVKKFVKECTNSGVFFKILQEKPNSDWLPDSIPPQAFDWFKDALADGKSFAPQFLKDMVGTLFTNGAIILPDAWFQDLKDEGIIVFDKISRDGDIDFIELGNLNTAKLEYLMKSVNSTRKIKSGILPSSTCSISDSCIYIDEKSVKGDTDTEICAKILYSMNHAQLEELIKE